MKTILQKMKNVGFWVSLAAAVMLILSACGIKIDAPYVNEIVNSICSLLVFLGILSDPDKGIGYIDNDKTVEPLENTNDSDDNVDIAETE